MSSGHSPPTVWSREIDSMSWASEKPRWRLRKGRWASINWGKPKARPAREILSAPGTRAGGLGQGARIQDKGRLAQEGQASGHGLAIGNLYAKVKEKMRFHQGFLQTVAFRRGLGKERNQYGCETKFFIYVASARVSLRAACSFSLCFQNSSSRWLL